MYKEYIRDPGDVAQLVEQLPSMLDTLGLNHTHTRCIPVIPMLDIEAGRIKIQGHLPLQSRLGAIKSLLEKESHGRMSDVLLQVQWVASFALR